MSKNMKFEIITPPFFALVIVACIALPGCSPRNTAQQETPSDTIVIAPPDKKRSTPDGKMSATEETENGFQAQGTVAEVTKPPKPGSVPYKDALVAVHLTNVQSRKGAPKEIVVYLWGMKDNQPTPASKIEKGQTLTLTLAPWDSVEEQYGGYNRVELSDPHTMSLEAYWGEMP